MQKCSRKRKFSQKRKFSRNEISRKLPHFSGIFAFRENEKKRFCLNPKHDAFKISVSYPEGRGGPEQATGQPDEEGLLQAHGHIRILQICVKISNGTEQCVG
jgi:hypothetical protein